MVKKSKLGRDRSKIATVFDRILLYEFDALEEHRIFAESSIKGSIKSLEARIEKESKQLDPDEHDDYFDYMHDEYLSTKEIVPRIQWNSQFLIVYSTFEHMLHELCRIVKRRSGFDLSFKDLGGLGIERSKNYLSKVAGVKSPFQNPDWQRAKLLAEIRNAIAHSNGEIEINSTNKKLLGTRLEKEQHLKLKKLIPEQEDAQIVLSSEFVRNSISELRAVLVAICNYKLYDK